MKPDQDRAHIGAPLRSNVIPHFKVAILSAAGTEVDPLKSSDSGI